MVATLNTTRSSLLSSNVCAGVIYGCTNQNAVNYNPNATIDDGSCCLLSGCTDSTAFNYNSNACYDDGSCVPIVLGCANSQRHQIIIQMQIQQMHLVAHQIILLEQVHISCLINI